MLHKQICALIFTLLLMLAAAGTALAHPELLQSDPPAGAELTAAPEYVRIFFNERLEVSFSSIELYNAQGQLVAGGGGRAAEVDSALELVLPPLAPGLYTVVWQTVGSDGHVIKGNYAFSILGTDATAAPAAQPATLPVATPAPVPSAAQTVAMATPVVPSALLQGLLLLAALALVGGWVVYAGVLRPALPANAVAAQAVGLRRWRLVTATALLLLLLLTGMDLALYTLGVAGKLDAESLRRVLFDLRWGQAALARAGLAVGLAGLLAGLRRAPALPSASGLAALLLGSALLLTFSVDGHAVAAASPTLAMLNDWLHLAGSALWVGGLLQLVLVLPVALAALDAPARTAALARLIVRFSTLALVSVVVLVASGTYAALQHLAALGELWSTGYGRALLVKLALFGGLVALGAYNMLLLRPRFVAWAERAAQAALMLRWQRRFRWSLRGEVLLAALAVLAAGFLTNLPPPTAQSRQRAAAAAPAATAAPVRPTLAAPPTRTRVPSRTFAETQRIEDVQVRLELDPASVRQDQFRITLSDAAGAPLNAQLVRLRFDMPSMDMGSTQLDAAPEQAGSYLASGRPLSMVGDWRVTVIVRRSDADDVEADFILPVGE